jgi:hypothetical protein
MQLLHHQHHVSAAVSAADGTVVAVVVAGFGG